MPLLMKIGKGLYHAYKDHSSSTENHDDHSAYPTRQDCPQTPASSYQDVHPPPYGYSDNKTPPIPRPVSSCEMSLSPPQLRDRPHSRPPPMHRPQRYPQPKGHPEQARVQPPALQPALQPSPFLGQPPHFDAQSRQHYSAQGFPQAYPQVHPRGLRPPHAQPYKPRSYEEGPYGAYGAQVPYSPSYSDEYIEDDYNDGYDRRRGRHGAHSFTAQRTVGTQNQPPLTTIVSLQNMPSAPQNQSSGGRAEVAPQDKSTDAFLKDGGYTSMNHFMQSYGLKMHNHDDIEEAKLIIQGLSATAQADYEYKPKQNGQGK